MKLVYSQDRLRYPDFCSSYVSQASEAPTLVHRTEQRTKVFVLEDNTQECFHIVKTSFVCFSKNGELWGQKTLGRDYGKIMVAKITTSMK